MNQNINWLISKLFRGDFMTKKHCCKMKLHESYDGKADHGRADACTDPHLVVRTVKKLVERIYLNFMRR